MNAVKVQEAWEVQNLSYISIWVAISRTVFVTINSGSGITTSQPNAHENDIDKYESGIYVQSLVYSLQTNQKSS